jgi:hypothetical protein
VTAVTRLAITFDSPLGNQRSQGLTLGGNVFSWRDQNDFAVANKWVNR